MKDEAKPTEQEIADRFAWMSKRFALAAAVPELVAEVRRLRAIVSNVHGGSDIGDILAGKRQDGKE